MYLGLAAALAAWYNDFITGSNTDMFERSMHIGSHYFSY